MDDTFRISTERTMALRSRYSVGFVSDSQCKWFYSTYLTRPRFPLNRSNQTPFPAYPPLRLPLHSRASLASYTYRISSHRTIDPRPPSVNPTMSLTYCLTYQDQKMARNTSLLCTRIFTTLPSFPSTTNLELDSPGGLHTDATASGRLPTAMPPSPTGISEDEPGRHPGWRTLSHRGRQRAPKRLRLVHSNLAHAGMSFALESEVPSSSARGDQDLYCSQYVPSSSCICAPPTPLRIWEFEEDPTLPTRPKTAPPTFQA